MSHRLFPVLTSVAFAAALLVSRTPAVSQGGATVSASIQACLAQGDDDKIIECATTNRLKNVLFFNHKEGHILYPVPAQLEVEDGAVFTIVFFHTDPRKFDYTLKGLSGPDDKAFVQTSSTTSTPKTEDVKVFVTWRHDRHFPLYQVQLSIRKDAPTTAPPGVPPVTSDNGKPTTPVNAQSISQLMSKVPPTAAQIVTQINDQLDAQNLTLAAVPKPAPPPQPQKVDPSQLTIEELQAGADDKNLSLVPKEDPLFEYTFPVWVKTSGWNITFNSGFGFSSLTSKKYYIATDAAKKKTVEVDPNRGDQSRPDIIALANLTLPRLKNPSLWWAGEKLGLAFGIGLGGDSDARYYFGPSYTLGKRFILNAGWTGGKVSTLPVGQRLHEPPINGDNTLGTLGSRFAHGWYVGISFTFTEDKESDFLNALTPPQQTGKGTADQTPAVKQ